MEEKYEQQFRKHAIHDSLEKLKTALGQAISSEKALPFLEDLNKIQKTTDFICEKIEAVDADLVPLATLNSINSHITNALSQMSSFLSNFQPQNIANAISQIDLAITFTPVLSSLAMSRENLENLTLARTSLNAFIQDITKTTENFEKKLSGMSNDCKKIDAAISEYKTKFDSELEKILTGYNKKIDEHFTEYDKKVKNIIDDSEAKHRTIIELYGIVAGDSVSGEYGRTSQSELTRANSLQQQGLLGLRFGIGWVFLCIVITVLNGATLGEIKPVILNLSAYHAIPAATITFIILSISVYLLFQSEKHREVSLWANQINLELKAFEPFIYSIEDKNIKIELRKALTNQLFGHIKNPQNAREKTETGLPIERLFEILKELLDAVKSKS